jgi:nitrate reductase gamma subunit
MSDWTTEAVDRIEEVVATVRDKTVVPAQNVTKALVYGLLTAFFVGTALTFLSIAAFRALSAYLPGGVYWAYLVLGGIFVIGGTLLWTRRAPKSKAG